MNREPAEGSAALVPSPPQPLAQPEPGVPAFYFAGGPFAEVWKAAQVLARSPLVPQHFRGQPESVLIALEAAHRHKQSPLLIMQNLYIVQGRACWASQYVIAMANASGKFRGGIRWRTEGSADELALTAYATLAETGEDVEFTVSLAMAKADGWYARNPKYKSLPDLMLRYRSATLLVRLFAPEVLLGYHAHEELVDAGKAQPTAEYIEPPSLPSPSPSRPQPSRTPSPTSSGGTGERDGSPVVPSASSSAVSPPRGALVSGPEGDDSSSAPELPTSAGTAAPAATSVVLAPEAALAEDLRGYWLAEVKKLQERDADLVRTHAKQLGLTSTGKASWEQLRQVVLAVSKVLDEREEAAAMAAREEAP